jgi:hypothetical protein
MGPIFFQRSPANKNFFFTVTIDPLVFVLAKPVVDIPSKCFDRLMAELDFML